MKLKAKDIKIIARNTQVKRKVIEKFGSLEQFAKVIGMTPKSVKQYFKQGGEYNENFKSRLCIHLGDYYSLWVPERKQLEEYVDILTRDIYSYTDAEDREMLKKVSDLSAKYNMTKCLAKSNRNLGMYHLNTGSYDKSLEYYELAMKYAKEIRDIDIICMVTGEMVTVYTYMSEYRKGDKLSSDFEGRYDVENASIDRRFWYYYSVSVLFIHDKCYPFAENYLKMAEGCAQSDYERACIYNLFGVLHRKNANYEKALYYYEEALRLCTVDRNKGLYYNNIASLYNALNNERLAKENINIALKYASLDDMENYIITYQTYVEIYNDQECIFKLLDILNKATEVTFIPYVLDALYIAMDRIENMTVLKRLIYKMIKRNKENRKFVHELYMLLGAMQYSIDGGECK